MKQVMLITGATGAFGYEFLVRALRDPGIDKIAALVRGASREAFERKRRGLLEAVGESGQGRLEVLRGDLAAKERLGMTREVYDALAGEVTSIAHSAADTKFTLPLTKARAANVEATVRLLTCARTFDRLEKIATFSTAYVAGRRTGVIEEGDLDGQAGFVNAYEQSKFEMEQAVGAFVGELPIAVYRLSTMIGDSATGSVRVQNAFHHSLRLLYCGLAPMVPGGLDCRVDFLPVDYAADAACWLFTRAFVPGRTYQICAGRSAWSLGDLLDAAAQNFARCRPAWRKRGIEPPAVVDAATFDLFVKTVEESGNEILTRATRSIRSFAYQLAYPKTFSTARTREGLKGSGVKPPQIRKCFSNVVETCIRTDWGAGNDEPTKL